MRAFMIAVTFLAVPASANATEYLTEVVSDVQQAEGMSADQIVQRGLQCIKSTGGNSATYVDPAIDGTTAYAIVKTAYTSMMIENIIRSRLSVIAKDGRFKVTHSDIESYNEIARGYIQIQKRWGTGWEKTQSALQERSSLVADCIVKKQENPVVGGDW